MSPRLRLATVARVTRAWRVATAVGVAALAFGATPASAQTETVEYYALDAVGSVRVVFDANGNIIGRMDFGPFGQELFGGTGMPDRRYAGLFRDGEAGLDSAGQGRIRCERGGSVRLIPSMQGCFSPKGGTGTATL